VYSLFYQLPGTSRVSESKRDSQRNQALRGVDPHEGKNPDLFHSDRSFSEGNASDVQRNNRREKFRYNGKVEIATDHERQTS